MIKLQGIVVPLVTPFLQDGCLDKESLARLTGHIIAGGVNGIFPCSTAGEFAHLSLDEKIDVVKTVTEVNNGRVPIYAGVTAESIEETIATLKEIEQFKPAGMVIAPLVYHSNRELLRHMEHVVNITSTAIILYNNDRLIKPPLKKANIRTKILKSISRLDRVIGLKDSSGDIHRFYNYLQAVKQRKDFAVLQGSEPEIFDGLKAGAKGAVDGLSNLFPELCVKLYKSFFDRPEQCAKIQQEITELGEIVYIRRTKIIGGIKRALFIKKIIKTCKTRDEKQNLSSEEAVQVARVIEKDENTWN